MPVTSTRWLADNFYGSLTKWCVPVFIMISGMMFLNPNKELTVKSIYTKYIPKLAISYIIWSVIYVLYSNWRKLPYFKIAMLKDFVGQAIKGHYHMWYIYTIIGFYMITSLLRKMIENSSKKMIEYFILLWMIFRIIIPTITLFPHTALIGTIAKSLGISFVMILIGYYVLGYYLPVIPISKKLKWIFYICGIIDAILTVSIATYMSLASGKPNRVVDDFYSPNVFLIAVGIFIFYRETVSKINLRDLSKKIILQISSCYLGIYLCHPLVIYFLNKIGLNVGAFHPIISVQIIVCTTFLISLIFTLAIEKIRFHIINIIKIH